MTDGLHHEKLGLATTAMHIEATDGLFITVIRRTPGEERDLQSHQADLRGHFTIVTILEVLDAWAKKKNTTLQKECVAVACDNRKSLRIHYEEIWFEPH